VDCVTIASGRMLRCKEVVQQRAALLHWPVLFSSPAPAPHSHDCLYTEPVSPTKCAARHVHVTAGHDVAVRVTVRVTVRVAVHMTALVTAGRGAAVDVIPRWEGVL
jgi:hypothetical protein